MRTYNPYFVIQSIPDLLALLPVTLLVLAATAAIGTVLGAILARAGRSRLAIVRKSAEMYIAGVRCTPPIVMLFMIYYGLPLIIQAIAGVDINSMNKAVFVIIALALLFSSNMAEIIRAAYESVDRGQKEAAVSIGLSEMQTFTRILLPQATAAALPNFTSSLVNLMKDGSLAYTIGLLDMMGQGTLIISRNHGAYGLEIYTALAIIYWLLTILTEKVLAVWEEKLSVGDAATVVSRTIRSGRLPAMFKQFSQFKGGEPF